MTNTTEQTERPTVGWETVLGYAREILARLDQLDTNQLDHGQVTQLGETLSVFAPSGLLKSYGLDRLSRHPCHPLRYSTNSRQGKRVHLLDTQSVGWPLPAAWTSPDFYQERLERLFEHEGMMVSYDSDLHVWRLYDSTCGIGVQLIDAPGHVRPWDIGAPLRTFLHWAVTAPDRRLIHAGTLAMDDVGVILAGVGGSGKTTTTVAGIASGLASVGDDYVWLERAAKDALAWKAHPVFEHIKLDDVGLERCGIDSSAFGAWPTNWQGKREIDRKHFAQRSADAPFDICAIFLPRITHGKTTTLTMANSKEAMLAIAPTSVFQLPCLSRPGIAFAKSLVDTLPSYHLSLSRDPLEASAVISDFLVQAR